MVGMMLLVEKWSLKAITQNSTFKAVLKLYGYWGFLSEG